MILSADISFQATDDFILVLHPSINSWPARFDRLIQHGTEISERNDQTVGNGFRKKSFEFAQIGGLGTANLSRVGSPQFIEPYKTVRVYIQFFHIRPNENILHALLFFKNRIPLGTVGYQLNNALEADGHHHLLPLHGLEARQPAFIDRHIGNT